MMCKTRASNNGELNGAEELRCTRFPIEDIEGSMIRRQPKDFETTRATLKDDVFAGLHTRRDMNVAIADLHIGSQTLLSIGAYLLSSLALPPHTKMTADPNMDIGIPGRDTASAIAQFYIGNQAFLSNEACLYLAFASFLPHNMAADSNMDTGIPGTDTIFAIGS
ncbi:hypothetical protein Aperf_G00000088410 [Anoplocephala perfoliata]